MLARLSVGVLAVLAFALIGMPAGGQAPAPPCPPGTQIVPSTLTFIQTDFGSGPTQSVAATHPVELDVAVPFDGAMSLLDPAIHITAPPGLQTTMTIAEDQLSAKAAFVPTVPGPLTFAATWTQLTQENGSPCTDSASATLTATAPTPVKASRRLRYSFDHRSGKPGSFNEFVLSTLVKSNPTTGDQSPIRLAVRAVTKKRRPPAKTRVVSLTLDPLHIPRHGVRASSGLVRLKAGPSADDAGIYAFTVGVFAHPRKGKLRAGRGVAITLTQGSRKLATYYYVTSCDSPEGGMECAPLPKGAPAP